MITRDGLCDVYVAVQCALAFPFTLKRKDWIGYSQDSARWVYADFLAHWSKAFRVLEKELIRTDSVWDKEKKNHIPSKRKVLSKNIHKARQEMEVTKALWDLMIQSKAITELESAKEYYPKTAFYVIDRDLIEIVDNLRKM